MRRPCRRVMPSSITVDQEGALLPSCRAGVDAHFGRSVTSPPMPRSRQIGRQVPMPWVRAAAERISACPPPWWSPRLACPPRFRPGREAAPSRPARLREAPAPAGSGGVAISTSPTREAPAPAGSGCVAISNSPIRKAPVRVLIVGFALLAIAGGVVVRRRLSRSLTSADRPRGQTDPLRRKL